MLLTAPVIYYSVIIDPDGVKPTTFGQVFELYKEWGYWVWVIVFMLCQAALLFLPVKLGSKRPKSRKPVIVPIIIASLFLGILLLALLFTIFSAIYLEEIGEVFAIAVVVVAIVSWIIWAFVFWSISLKSDANHFSKKINRFLIRGSILELLVAVPAHIYIRSRNQCSAEIFSLFGITVGLSVMLMAFGPAVYILYRERIKAKQSGASDDESQ